MTSRPAAAPLTPLDEPWRRMPLVALLAGLTWLGLLTLFGVIIRQASVARIAVTPLEARIVELPASGLAGGAPAAAPAHKTAAPPVVRPAPRPLAPVRRRVAPPKVIHHAPPIPATNLETANPAASPAPPAASASTAAAGGGGPSATSGTSRNAGAGGSSLGAANTGARAIYAPVPEIPDDLRDQVTDTEAVAHFAVAYDGTVTVTLTQPTANPQLNAILLNTLRQWRFQPAEKDGIAIAAEFDVRIPISVQ